VILFGPALPDGESAAQPPSDVNATKVPPALLGLVTWTSAAVQEPSLLRSEVLAVLYAGSDERAVRAILLARMSQLQGTGALLLWRWQD
jgi:hypothetical protein